MAIGPIAQAVAEVAKVVGAWMNSADRRRLETALDSAEKYIFINEGEGEYKNLPEHKKKSYLVHYRKVFFSHNN